MTRLLALDLSMLSTGWAFGDTADRRPTQTGVQKFGGADEFEEFVWSKALDWIWHEIKELSPDRVAIEAPIMTSAPKKGGRVVSNPRTIMVQNGLNTVFRTIVLRQVGKPAISIAPSTARKAFTGKGRFEAGKAKPEVFSRCKALGWVKDGWPFDISDACAIWVAAAMRIDSDFAANFTPLSMAVSE